MYNAKTDDDVVTPIRKNIATGLMLVAALGAVYAFIAGIGVATSAGPATQVVEWWRALGFLMFAGVFVLLAIWPHRYPGLWELVILNKAALTLVTLLLIGNNAEGALSTAIADGILTVILVVSYILIKGYNNWSLRR